jgi:GNAT superfamily N-acetyltransferase
MPISIRKIGFSDLGDVTDLLYRSFEGFNPGSKLALLAAITSVWPLKLFQLMSPLFEVRPGYHFHLALQDNLKIAGVIGVYEMLESRWRSGQKLCDHDLGSRQNIWIEWFAVEEKMRGQGVGTALLKSFVGEALKMSAEKGYDSPNICLINENKDVLKNHAAKRYYDDLGLKPVVILGGESETVIRSIKLVDLVAKLADKGVDLELDSKSQNYLQSISRANQPNL